MPSPSPSRSEDPVTPPAEFVCEDDVRQAVRDARPIVIDDRTIITPAARDLAERHQTFVRTGLSL